MCCRCREDEAKEGTWRMAEGAKKTHTHTDHSKQEDRARRAFIQKFRQQTLEASSDVDQLRQTTERCRTATTE